jgi:phosphoserine aminotransferase
MWNYNNTNLAILETSHRSPVFAKVNDDTILALRKYLNVPDNYKVLLMQGGEQLTQGAIPFNLLK